MGKLIKSNYFVLNYIYIALAAFMIIFSGLYSTAVYADDNNNYLYDDYADFSKIAEYSEGLALDVVTDDNKYAFSGDDTHLIRVTSDAEWLIYDIGDILGSGYFVFNTAFSPNESISHFTFEYTIDGTEWKIFNPIITTEAAENGGWIPVIYSLKKLNNIAPDATRLRVTFGNVGGTAWSPCLESLELHPYSANSGETGFVDCIGTEYYDATAKLKNLGLISGYSETEFEPSGNITRAEFSKMTARLLSLDETLDPTALKAMFKDVDDTYWGAGAIYSLYALGIVSGDGDGYFSPEDNITLDEAIKIIVSSLGYTVTAEDKGGYPTGYIYEANRLDILDDIEYKDGAITRGTAALLMNNSLDVPIVTQTSFGSSSVYEYGTDTILTKYHDIVTLKGEITDVGEASVYSEGGTGEGGFVVGGTRCLCGDVDAMPYLAQETDVYVKNGKDGSYTALYIERDKNTTVSEIACGDYIGIDDDGVHYTNDDDREKRISVTGDTKIIYNYKYMTRVAMLEGDSPELDCGFIRTVANGGGTADYILIFNFDTYFTSGTARLGGTLNDRYKGAVHPGFENAELVMLLCDGEEVEYSDDYTIPTDTILCAAVSEDGRIADIRISLDYAFGAVTMVDGTEYTIDGRVYDASEYFVSSGRTVSPSSETVTAYLDINGRIVDFSNSASGSGEEYGYLRAAEDGDGFSSSVVLQVITASGTARELTATSRTSIDGSTSALGLIESLSPQLIKYTLRSDGTLASIKTATAMYGAIDRDEFTLNYSSDSAKFYDTINVFASKYQLDGSTKVFVVPSDLSDISKYLVTDYTYLLSDTAYNVEIFDLSDEYKAGAVVIKKATDDGEIYNYSSVCVVIDSGTYVSDDGEKCLSLHVYDSGEEKMLYIDADGATDRTDGWIPDYTVRDTEGGKDPFAVGEVMQYTESDGVLTSFRMLLTKDVIDNSSYYEHNLGDYGALSEELFYSELYSAYGIVNKKFTDKMLFCGDTENGYLRTIPLSGSVYVLNRRTNKLYLGDASDIEQDAGTFVQMRFGTAGAVVVIRD